MKRFLLAILVVAATVSIMKPVCAQSADETYQWLDKFTAGHGGIHSGSTNGPLWDVYENGVAYEYRGDTITHQAFFPYSGMTTVASWHTANEHFVRITGECQGNDCPDSGKIDLYLADESNEANIGRFIKAIVHMADLNGAKVNQKEPF